MKILAIVPARYGSKGFPQKNIKTINGKTLIEYAVNVGLDCNLIEDVYISSDSQKYIDIAKNLGAKSVGIRLEELSDDNSKTVDVVIDLINNLEKNYDLIILLQPTSPIRCPQDIENMIKLLINSDAESCVSVCQFEEPHPHKLKGISEDGFLVPFIDKTTSEVTRQSLPKVYALNGAIYIIRVDVIMNKKTFFPSKTIPYIMNSNINIDSEKDLIYLKIMNDLNLLSLWDS